MALIVKSNDFEKPDGHSYVVVLYGHKQVEPCKKWLKANCTKHGEKWFFNGEMVEFWRHEVAPLKSEAVYPYELRITSTIEEEIEQAEKELRKLEKELQKLEKKIENKKNEIEKLKVRY